jgi:hypothetical protein
MYFPYRLPLQTFEPIHLLKTAAFIIRFRNRNFHLFYCKTLENVRFSYPFNNQQNILYNLDF